jgi:hypothetical protein
VLPVSGESLEDEEVGENGSGELLELDRGQSSKYRQSQRADDGGGALRARGCYCALKQGRAWLALCFRTT